LCIDGYLDCNHDIRDGCEENSAVSATACGGCGRACAGTCVAGECRANTSGISQEAYIKSPALTTGFGESVATSDDGNVLVTTAIADDWLSLYLLVFRRTAGTWHEEFRQVFPETEFADTFEVTVSGDGNRIAAMASTRSGDASTHVYRHDAD